jgi:3'-phosphoadenosine 5'-phosphosulfate sulfotransferase (PAPS reductase)/FAD synthetase
MQYTNIIQCSMGRDSLALVHYLRDEWEDSLVVWVDAGAPLPEVEKIAEFVKAQVPHFLRVETNSAKWIEEHGIPADVIPIWQHESGAEIAGFQGQKIASSLECCLQNIMLPLHSAAVLHGVKRIYRGQRTAEALKSPVRSGAVFNGIEIVFPLENWTDAEVCAYLLENGWPLSPWYQYGNKGMECWHCSGYAQESKGAFQYLAEQHPEKWSVVERRLQYIRESALSALF